MVASLFSSLVFTVQAQNNLRVRIYGLDDSKGKVMVALFNSEQTFLTPNVSNAEASKVVGTSAEVVFDDLEAGEYGIALFQDSNDNNQLDLGESMIPLEKYGFSNNVDPAVLGRQPRFSECKFTITGDQEIVINAVSAQKQK